MSISRNNYEEYFLLYADNELSGAERNRVEVFISKNPDLREELLMLQQTIVHPDPVIFSGKENLFRPLPVDAGTEEKLLLLLDNELPTKDKEQLLAITKSNKAVEENWQLLQQTKLTPTDSIVFEDKASLYRKEERKVVPIRWWQLAAAAMLIGFGLWGTVSYLDRDRQAGISTATVTTIRKTTPVAGINAQATIAKDTVQNLTGAIKDKDRVTSTATAQRTQNSSPAKAPKTMPAKDDNQVAEQQQERHNNNIVQQQYNSQDVPTTDLQNLNNNNSNIPATAIVTPKTNPVETVTLPANEYAVNVAAGSSDENSFSFDDEDEDKPKRSKLGGFFKRVKRTFERKTKIKTGSSDDVKIANMSFAMH